jgi:hypothetical protein
MTPFLLELARTSYAQHKRNLDEIVYVFPNRRASLYFRKHLTSLLDRPSFSPALITIEEFISAFTSLKVPDKLLLIHRLQRVYNEVVLAPSGKIHLAEPFDQFYYWGEMLLRDFDETDKYMASADHLFKDLSNQKELDTLFDYLTEEQREFLKSFWLSFDEKDSLNKQRFLEMWQRLPLVYDAFHKDLLHAGMAYEGMVHREVAANIKTLANSETWKHRGKKIIFAGFNALTKAEEVIISFFVEHRSAEIFWDIDDYYVNNERQEAAKFFREYKAHSVLGKTFPPDVPANFKSQTKTVSLYSAPQPIGQAKVMAQILTAKLEEGYKAEETLVVLPDEKLLMPVLHGISSGVEKLNVTMGFPLSSTPLYNLIELLIELQLSHVDGFFNHRPVLALLGHPYVVSANAAVAQAKRKEILYENWVSVSGGFLQSKVELHRLAFSVVKRGSDPYYVSLLDYLRSMITETGSLSTVTDLDREFCFHFIRLLNKMQEVLSGESPVYEEGEELKRQRRELKSFLRLFRQVLKTEKIPFSGEPLAGLQVMGVLETRNLDFRNVFMLSLNEGSLPSFASHGSFIPYNIRKAYGLPTVDKQDAMYAYLFYRVLQRAENVFLFYNSETDDLGQGEMSRYLQQLVFESGIKIQKYYLHNELQPLATDRIVVEKDERVFNALATYCEGARYTRDLSPTALNDYMECRLKFYFRYVEKIKEPNSVEEDLDARVLGNFLHFVMEYFYKGIIEAKGSNVIERADFDDYEKRVPTLIDKAFIENYGLKPDKKVVYEGQRLVVREIVQRFVDRIISIDRDYTPFSIEALERRDLTYRVRLNSSGNPTVILGGSIDRADRKDDVLRVIDYKTGRDQLDFKDIESLFSRDDGRNKAAFQTFMYTLLYMKNLGGNHDLKLIPGLLNRINLFKEDFRFGLKQNKGYLADARPMMDDFDAGVKALLEEIFDEAVPFDQTLETAPCQYCLYRKICYR